MILLIDNYDSFVYNIVQSIATLGFPCLVKRNDSVALTEIETLSPTHIIISPGPCTPNEAGISCSVIRRFAGRIPLLGVCLGHQCLGTVFGGSLVRCKPIHGKQSLIEHDGKGLFRELPTTFTAARYHSLTISNEKLPGCLEVSARTADGLIMGLYSFLTIAVYPFTIDVTFVF